MSLAPLVSWNDTIRRVAEGTDWRRLSHLAFCAGVAFWRKGDNDLGARLRLIASSSDGLENARSY